MKDINVACARNLFRRLNARTTKDGVLKNTLLLHFCRLEYRVALALQALAELVPCLEVGSPLAVSDLAFYAITHLLALLQ